MMGRTALESPDLQRGQPSQPSRCTRRQLQQHLHTPCCEHAEREDMARLGTAHRQHQRRKVAQVQRTCVNTARSAQLAVEHGLRAVR